MYSYFAQTTCRAEERNSKRCYVAANVIVSFVAAVIAMLPNF